MAWITPIADRTATDISYAKANRGNVAANKGTLNPRIDLNRIEGNCAYLAGQLNAYGYYVVITVKTDWTDDDFPRQSEVDRIRDNVNTLLDMLYKLPGSPDIRYWDSLDWNDMNSLEQNILNLDILLQRMAAVFLRCGDAHGGDR
jgi:hypothetical protein